jgi:hypothetical protein
MWLAKAQRVAEQSTSRYVSASSSDAVDEAGMDGLAEALSALQRVIARGFRSRDQ